MARTNTVHHVYESQLCAKFGGTSCWLDVPMAADETVAAFFASPDDVRATIASLTEALAQWEAHLASKSEAA